ncbi:hypothetical protein JYT19_00950 [Sulfobacillus acidophilus]|uniref:Thiol:disulfide interchange protein DsbD N-terminal domain-containing protein n=1 Tax=Sulfobacillus acidophilus TaxID=53633 RepID=A0ABS3AYX3_9FIRM|nr:hypothetical protein [Sulfobacillus acidophilus]
MKFRFFIPFIASLLCLPACKKCENKQKPGAVVQKAANFKGAFSFVSTYNEKTKILTQKIKLKDGFHAYGEGEKIGRPANMIIDNKDGWQMIGKPILPNGQMKDLGILGKSIVLDKKFEISAKVDGGKGPIVGALRMQICSSNACDKPRSHQFEVKNILK